MNWYKNILIAAPLVENKDGRTYYDVGHNTYFERLAKCEEYIWTMYYRNGEFLIKSKKIVEMEDNHADYFGDTPEKDEVAYGRYEKCENEEPKVSVIMVRKNIPNNSFEFYRDGIEKALDKRFDNQEIIRFEN